MDKATFIEKVDKYIDGNQSDAEKQEFLDMINSDIDLKKQFDDHVLARKAIKMLGREQLRSELIEMRSSLGENQPKSLVIIKSYKFWASVAALFVGIAVVYWSFPRIINHKGNDITNTESSNTKDTVDSNIDFMYEGDHEVRILPKQGNLGGPNITKRHVKVGIAREPIYYFQNDTLIIMMEEYKIYTFLQQQSLITVMGNQELEIKASNEIYYILKSKQ